MQLFDLIDGDDTDWLLRNGYVRQQSHPSEPLNIMTYSDKAQIEGEQFWRAHPSLWNLRGLIYNIDSGEIVARPFRKFWNYGQGAADQIMMDEHVNVTDKLDGSLGIMYREPNGGMLAIATRGSFTSEQADHATKVLRLKYTQVSLWGPEDPRDKFSPADEETFLFEIVYPKNRIVLNYGTTDDLFLLGSVDIYNGHVFSPTDASAHLGWQGSQTPSMTHTTLADALAAPPRPNREGMVVRAWDGRMVKIKQEDYIALHKIVTGLSERRVWQALVAGQTPAQICEPLPDEFHVWVLDVAGKLLKDFRERYFNLLEMFRNTMDYAWRSGMIGLDDDGYRVTRDQRGALAKLFKEADEDAWAMFALLDYRDISAKLWKQLEPKGDVRPNNTPKEV